MTATSTKRPRVLILGGGFAGIGAAQKLHEGRRRGRARRPPRLPHLPAAALPARDRPPRDHGGRPLAARPARAPGERHRPPGDGHRRSISTRARSASTASRRSRTTTSSSASAPRSTSSGPRVRRSTPSRCTRCRTPIRLKDHLLERWEAADRDPAVVDDGALNVVIVGGGPTGVETAGAIAELYRAYFARDYPDAAAGPGARDPGRGGAGAVLDVQAEAARRTRRRRSTERTVEVMTGEMVASVSPTRVTLKSGTELKAHTLVWGAGLQGNRLVQTLGIELQRGNRIGGRARPDAAGPSRGVRRRRHRGDRGREDRQAAPARLGRAAVGRARGRDRSPAGSQARRRSRSTTATRGRWRRSAAAPRSCRCSAGAR